MAISTTELTTTAPEPIAPPAEKASRRRFRFVANPKAAIGLGVFVFYGIFAIIGPWIAPYNPSGRSRDLLQSPSAKHWFGTDHIGQDIFSQILVGTRSVMFVGVVAGVIATILSILIGVSAGYFSKAAGETLSAISNVFLVIPALPLIIIVTSMISGAGDWLVATIIGLTSWAWGSRILRAQTLSLRNRDYVQAAKATGEKSWRIILLEILPNLTAVIASSFVGTVIFAVMAEITLAFIGIGGGAEWNWGTVLYWAQSQEALAQGAWWWFVPAGLAIAILGTALAMLNFGIDEFVNPRLRDSGGHKVKTKSGSARMRVGFTPVARDEAPDLQPNLVMQANPKITTGRRPVLEIRNLDVDYGVGEGSVRAVRDVSLTLHRGEVLGLAGESGSGKSTLAYGLTRLLAPPGVIRNGQVIYHPTVGESYDVLSLNDKELRSFRWAETSIVFQGAMNSLNPVHKISKQLTDVLKAHRPEMSAAARMDRAKELLSLVGISPDRLDSFPHQLSGGMRQRVMIGMALALEPQVVIMDEPTTALDVVMQRQILAQLVELRERMEFSVIFITHDLSLLVEFSDRIAIMYGGRIVEEAPAAALYRDSLHPYSDGLLHSFPALRGERRELTGIPGSPPDLAGMPSGCAFHPRCPHRFAPCDTDVPVLGIPLSTLPAANAAAGVSTGAAMTDRSVRMAACWLHEIKPTVGEKA
jgi:oligopeptide/dipeptide ABC transporter ATP-binding protein